MKIGIIGLSQSGKATVFNALTRSEPDPSKRSEDRMGMIQVPDERVDVMSEHYHPRKTIYARVEYFLPGKSGKDNKKDPNVWQPVRDCDALIHVVRNFASYGLDEPDPVTDFSLLDQDMIISDLVVAEKRLERLELDNRRGKKPDPEEIALLKKVCETLENEEPLRHYPELAEAPVLRGFAFVSAKPVLVLLNNGDDDDVLPDLPESLSKEDVMIIRAKLEEELAQMSEEEGKEFLAEFDISEPAMEMVIRRSYELLGLMSFFTVGEDEVRAWTIRKQTSALEAAGAIHSDIKKGFIRAEVISYKDHIDAGTYAEARKRGTVRLEGKTYEMMDGDIVHFRFNV